MVTPVGTPKLNPIILKFSGGVNSRATESDIDPAECVDGKNFSLDLLNSEFKNRQGIDLVATAPNNGSIDGYAQLKKVDGTITTLIQAGTNVYSWDGESNFTLVGTVTSGTKLRGPLSANSLLDDKVIIGDLAVINPVLEWNGTALSTMTHNLSGDFKAAYTFSDNERMFYANVESNGTATPHMIVGSERGNYDNLSVSSRPSSAATASDPFFLLTLDLRPVKGVVSAFDRLVFSSKEGSTYQLTGSDKKDFAIKPLYPNSFASGDESITYVGNDIFYGRPGRIESIVASDAFGDVESDDLTRWIADSIEDYDNWTLVYNSRTQRVYCFANGKNVLWVLHKPILDAVRRIRAYSATQKVPEFSPWMKWTTRHPIDFKPTSAFTIFDPTDGLLKVFMGDSTGSIYRLEGSSSDDAGLDVDVERTSLLYSSPLDADLFEVEGYLSYRNNEAVTAEVTLLWAGEGAFGERVNVTIPATTDGAYYGGAAYYGGPYYYGSATRGKLLRKNFPIAGRERAFQVKTRVAGQSDFNIQEIGLRFKKQQ